MMARLFRFARDRSGVTAIEYGLIAALVGVAIIGSATFLGVELEGLFETSGNAIESTATNFD